MLRRRLASLMLQDSATNLTGFGSKRKTDSKSVFENHLIQALCSDRSRTAIPQCRTDREIAFDFHDISSYFKEVFWTNAF